MSSKSKIIISYLDPLNSVVHHYTLHELFDVISQCISIGITCRSYQ